MSFSIRAITCRILGPRHELSCSRWLWHLLTAALRERGLGGSRESGAFLLGQRDGPRARVLDFILYDDLDPHALDTGIVRFNGVYFSELWAACRERDMRVVADVHVHPGSAHQSRSDQEHPMISRSGHIALVLPNFARSPLWRSQVGIYRYAGKKQWHTVPARERRRFFHIGL